MSTLRVAMGWAASHGVCAAGKIRLGPGKAGREGAPPTGTHGNRWSRSRASRPKTKDPPRNGLQHTARTKRASSSACSRGVSARRMAARSSLSSRRCTLKVPTRYSPPPMTSAPANISSDARGPTLLGTFRATPIEAYPPGGAISCTPTRGGGRGGVASGAMVARPAMTDAHSRKWGKKGIGGKTAWG